MRGVFILVLQHKDNKLLSICRDFKSLDDFYMDLRLFFSWQSDTDSKKLHQTKFIKACIKSAIANVNSELKHVNIEYQEGVKLSLIHISEPTRP